jgi:hypothetical protein
MISYREIKKMEDISVKNIKKCLIVGVFLISVILTQVFVHDVLADSDTVTFTDPNLEAVIREAINKNTGEIQKSDVSGITSIMAENKNISNLTGKSWRKNK